MREENVFQRAKALDGTIFNDLEQKFLIFFLITPLEFLYH